MLNSLVQLVQVCIGVTQCTLCCRADHLVALTAELLQCVDSLLPLAEVGLADTDVELSQIASVGRAVVGSHLLETNECLVVLLLVEELLTLSEFGAGLVSAGLEIIVVCENNAYDDSDNGCYTANDGLLVLVEEGFGLSDLLLYGSINRVQRYKLVSKKPNKNKNFRTFAREMILRKLSILNYKNIGEAQLELSPKMNCFIGRNGMGKTNVLDAVYYLSFCRSASNPIDSQVIRHDEPFCMIEGEYGEGDERLKMKDEKLIISVGMKRGQKKHFKRNKKEYKRLSEHIGLIPLVVVSPADTLLIEGGSEERRKLMDMVIAQYDRSYIDALSRYNNALQQRNTLLKQASAAEVSSAAFDPLLIQLWEEQMAEAGEQLFEKRRAFVDELVPLFQQYYEHISGGQERVGLTYVSHCQRGPLLEVIQRDRHKDLAVGYSLHGVHRDDLEFTLDGHLMKREGSQGQNKTYVIALKLAQFDFLKRTGAQTTPLLLLDDIFDKLDAQRVEQIVRLVSSDNFGQIFITDTNRDHLDQILSTTTLDYKIFHVSQGEIDG